MGNITIDVVGNSSGGSQQPPQTQQGGFNQPGSSISPGVSEADQQRLVNDIRREMQQRGVVFVPGSNNVNQIISQYTQQVQKQGGEQIQEKYEKQRDILRENYDKRRAEIVDKRQKLDPAGSYEDYEEVKRLRKQEKELTRKYEEESEEINAREKEEKDKYNEDVVSRMREIVEILKKDSTSNPDNPNSYIGNLRREQREILQERESALTKEEAMDASKRLAIVNEKLREATGTGGNRYFRDPVLQTAQGIQGFFGDVESGNVGGMISNLGMIGIGLSGASIKTAMKALPWVYAVAELANATWRSAERYEKVAPLAAYKATSGGYSGSAAMNEINAYLADDVKIAGMGYGSNISGVSWSDLGFTRTEFMQEASSRIRARGMSQDWYNQTMRQVTLEAALALESGALREGSRYDRYGINVTDAVSKMVTALSAVKGSGVTRTDFSRVQEKYDIQQQIMQSYLGRTDRPNYDVATSNLAAFSAIRGITQDSRLGSDYAVFQNAIQNPMNDKFKALLYNTVSNIPGLEYTRGRPDLIERAIIDPDNEGKIIQAVIKNIKQIYGGTETTMGYYSFRNLFPNISPDRLDAYISELSDSGSVASAILSRGIDNVYRNSRGRTINQVSEEWQDTYVREAKSYHSEMISAIRGFSNDVQALIDLLSGRRSVFGGGNGVRSAAGTE